MVAPEYRYPDHESVPQYLRGITASDAAQLLQAMVDSAARGAAAPAAIPAPLPAATDDDYVTGAHLRQAQQQALAQVNPFLQTVADQQATFGYNVVKKDHADIFKKYEPEVVAVLNRVPRHLWTLDVIENAVKFVKGNHVDEIAAEKVRALESTMHPTMRSTGRAGMGGDSQNQDTVAVRLEKTPASWRARAEAVGITDQDLHEYCRMNDITPDEFFKQFEPGLLTDAVADVSFKRALLG